MREPLADGYMGVICGTRGTAQPIRLSPSLVAIALGSNWVSRGSGKRSAGTLDMQSRMAIGPIRKAGPITCGVRRE